MCVDDERTFRADNCIEGDDAPVGPPRRSRQRTCHRADGSLRSGVRCRHGVDPAPILAIRHIGDLSAVWRPGRRVLVGGAPRDLPKVSCGERQHPHIVVAAPVARKHDTGAVAGPVRLAVVKRTPRQLRERTAVRLHAPDVPGTGAVGLKRDARAIGGPRRLARVHQFVRNALGRSARSRHCPDRAEQVDGNGASIW